MYDPVSFYFLPFSPPTSAGKQNLFLFSPTRQKNPCQDSSSIEYIVYFVSPGAFMKLSEVWKGCVKKICIPLKNNALAHNTVYDIFGKWKIIEFLDLFTHPLSADIKW